MIGGPEHDSEVAGYWETLGLPGAIDLHVHFMPDRVMRKVWAFFDGVDGPGGFDPRDPVLRPVWARLAATRTPVIVHAGSGPQAGRHTGPQIFGQVLEEHPELVAVIAHMGLPEYAEFLDLALRYPHVHLDTTMVFTGFTEQIAPFPPALVPRLADHGDRIVLGSDFPNIPYTYAHQVDALARLGLGADWLRQVCWDNPARLLQR